MIPTLGMVVGSQLLSLPQVYVTPYGLKGLLAEALDTAGAGGILFNFPQTTKNLHGFIGMAMGMPMSPTFWVLFEDLKQPSVTSLKPLSWADQWQVKTCLTSAQYLEFRLKQILLQNNPDWLELDMLTRHAILQQLSQEVVWDSFVSGVTPDYEQRWVEMGDGNDRKQAEMSCLRVQMYDGSVLLCPKGREWPKVQDHGTMKMVKLDEGNTKIVHEFTYELKPMLPGARKH